MTDDISKVGNTLSELRSELYNQGQTTPVCFVWAAVLDKVIATIESAHLPNPCEIGSKSVDAAAPVGVDRSMIHQARAWEAVFDTLLEVVPGWSAPPGSAKDLACATIRTLARQLAEAKEWAASESKDCLRMVARLSNAEAQLAEANRRLAEVEGLVTKWRVRADEHEAVYARTATGFRVDWESHGKAESIETCADELDAALQPKEL